MTAELDQATSLVLALIPAGPLTDEDLVRACDDVLKLLSGRGSEIPDREVLIRTIQSKVIVEQLASEVLEDLEDHVDWLPGAHDSTDWTFWDRYRRYLEQIELLPPVVISRLDDSTSRVLSLLEDPERPGPWDRRGLVVGQVQSGKTSHYTALACKAVDAGYKLIVVLAGMHDSLRCQTQLRLDQGLLGFDTQFQFRTDEKSLHIGVGSLPGAARPPIASLTSSKDDGDFQAQRAKHLNLPIGQIPILLVVKKNSHILKNLITWLTTMQGGSRGKNQTGSIPDVPLIVIDDEADNASINTKKEDADPAAINRHIRTLLNSFDKSAYIGYTATPFANIFAGIDQHARFGQDLFPRHFVESVKAPSNYFGPARVFGLGETEQAAPVFRPVDDNSNWIPDKHKKDLNVDPGAFPDSLERAVYSFFLNCAARRARGQTTAHNSMLIHTTRFVRVQAQVKEQVEDLVSASRYRLRYGDGTGPSLLRDLRTIWESDQAAHYGFWEGTAEPLNWERIEAALPRALEKIVVMAVNGDSQDALQYYEKQEEGVSVIAIGGDKLSRGLTLEGLSVSYYLRASKMYDTLLQMGRWFGYRDGYEDLCRLYTTPSLFDWYREITLASEELRADFDDMVRRGGTPSEFGLKVRQSSAGLLVTSPAKMRKATRWNWTYSGDISESVTFSTKRADVESNLGQLDDLVAQADASGICRTERPSGNVIWDSVPGAVVATFFDGYIADSQAKRARPELLARYIRDALSKGELREWTVVLASNTRPNKDWQSKAKSIGGREIGLTQRTCLNGEADVLRTSRYTIGRLVSPTDEALDFSQSTIDHLTASNGGRFPGGPALRDKRPASRGLLILYLIHRDDRMEEAEPLVGFAASFPATEKGAGQDFQANEIFTMAAMALDEDDEE